MLAKLSDRFPLTVFGLVDLVPSFGYFKDWSLLLERLGKEGGEPGGGTARELETRILAAFTRQLRADGAKLDEADAAGERAQLSLAAKWAPREGRHFSAQAKALAKLLYPEVADEDAARRLYRKRVTKLNRALLTPEVLMGAHRFAELDFTHVPSLCMNRNRKAFLNEKVRGSVPPAQLETGNRRPDDDDRVQARKKQRAAVASGAASKLKGAQLMPHEIARTAMAGRKELSAAETDVLNAQ
mmetsp:Transcript_45986/g.107402  ORF Transcript_45986/g.107402 Transcript_45986/m.107402 type:complete len:242 (+) Transcript_45986:424-1149(+)